MDIFDLVAKLSLDTSEYEKELAGAEKEAKSAGGGIGGALGGAIAGAITGGGAGAAISAGLSIVTSGVTAVTDAVGAMGSAVADGSKMLMDGVANVAEYGDTIDKESQKLGISAEAYQEWDAVLHHAGGSISSLKPALKTLSKEIVNNSDAFQELGLSQEEIINMPVEDVLSQVITKLQEMPAGIERTRLATQLLGKSSVELGALLNTSAEETQAMKDRVHELGGVMSDEAVKASAGFQDSLQDLTTGFDGIKRKLLSDFMPAMTEVMDGLTDILAGDSDKGIEEMTKGIEGTINNLSESIPKFTQIAVPLVQALADGILQNIPLVIPAIGDLITQLGNTILKYLPMVLDVTQKMLVEIANGLSDSLPVLIPAVTDIILSILEVFSQNSSQGIEAGIMLMQALADGILAAMPMILERLPLIIEQILTSLFTYIGMINETIVKIMIQCADFIIDNMPLILTAIGDLMSALFDAIVTAAQSPESQEAVTNMMSAIGDFITERGQDAIKWGTDLIANFIKGMEEKFPDLKGTLTKLAELVKSLIGFSEPDIGPLSNFHTFAPDMMELFAQGIRDNTRMLQDQLSQSFDFQPEIAGAMGNTPAVSGGAQRGSQSAIGPLTVIFELDKMEFGRAVYEVNNAETQRVGLRIANV